jgi:hypothetical protein
MFFIGLSKSNSVCTVCVKTLDELYVVAFTNQAVEMSLIMLSLLDHIVTLQLAVSMHICYNEEDYGMILGSYSSNLFRDI